MAISFPRTDIFSSFDFLTQNFSLQYQQEISRLRGGQMRARSLGPAIWMGSFVTGRISWDDCVELESVLDSLQGSLQAFTAHDTRRPMPKNYPFGGFSDTGQISAIGTGGTTLSLSGLDGGMQLKRGDAVSFDYVSGANTLRGLVRLMEDVTASGGGATSAVPVEPYVPVGTSVSTPVNLVKPSVLMLIEPGSVQFNDAGQTLGTVSFTAQELR